MNEPKCFQIQGLLTAAASQHIDVEEPGATGITRTFPSAALISELVHLANQIE